jgi:hypothetical protein
MVDMEHTRGESMAAKTSIEKPGNINVREVPRDLLARLKMVAAIERKTVKDVILELILGKVQDMERKGLLPKGK